MYVVVHKDNHFVGGTEGGVQFIKECGAYVPYSFIGYLSAKQSGEILLDSSTIIIISLCMHTSGYTSGPRQQTGSCDKNDLRKGVESLFNDLYSKDNCVHECCERSPTFRPVCEHQSKTPLLKN